MHVKERVAVVTGAAGGIGAALARALLEAGAYVALTDLEGSRLGETTDDLLASHPDRLLAVSGDASVSADISAVISAAEKAFGQVDLYFANAGVGGGPGLEATDAEWQLALDVNVLAHVRAARLLIPGWVERGEGYFISTASAAGLVTQIGSATYAVSKHGAVSFAEWLAVTYGARGVRVSCLCPMGVNTAMLNEGSASEDSARQAGARAVTEAGGVLEAADVADQVLAAMTDERFLILPHPDVLEFFRRKSTDYDRWIRGMQRYQDALA